MSFTELLARVREVLNYPLLKVGEGTVTLAGIVGLIVLVISVLVLERIVRRQLVNRLLRRTRLDLPLQYAIGRITGYVFIALGIYVALQLVGINLTSLAFIAGAVGVGIGFGLQNIVNNFVSGLIILAERPIAIGDRIEVSGVAGRVTRMSLRSTTVVTNDNISIIVPNADFITQPVTNWSHGDPRVQIRLALGVAYGSDLEKLQRVLLQVAAENSHVMKDPAPSVYFIGFGDSSLNFELGLWTQDMTHSPRRFRSELYFAVEKALRANEIEIPFPQRDLHLRSGQFVAPVAE
jgi:small-conductance mechanosensitive channel